jgi:murein L,D-transpeptidase YcbB/YkuD
MSVRTIPVFLLLTCVFLLADNRVPARSSPGARRSAQSAAQPLTPEGVVELQREIKVLATTGSAEIAEAGFAHDAQALYSALGYSLAWVAGNQPTSQARQIIEELKHADEKGLQPEDYDGPSWDVRVAAFMPAKRPSDTEKIAFDVSLTFSTMRFLAHLHHGRVNPDSLHFALSPQRKPFEVSEFLRANLLHTADVHTAVGSVEPQFFAYRRTLDALHTYLALARKESGSPLPRALEGIWLGDSHPALPLLAQRLQLLGDLGASQSQEKHLYDRDIQSAVARFQSRHGLDANGNLDRATLDQLNTPLARRVLQLQLTLERWRWLPQTFTVPPVVVNIPEFRLYAFREDHRVAMDMNVVAGRAYRHETPVFTSSLRSVVFRPYWNVPLTIQRNELLPEIDSHPNYLADNTFEIVDAGDQVPVNADDPQERDRKLKSGEWLLRQKPGPRNSLGLVKFELPNPYEIYLHGTPAQELFAKSRRDFSHGCIRVEDPVALAVWILRGNPEWSEERIRSAMNGEATVRVNLKEPIPVWILYGTAVVREDGEVHFLEDIYGHDAALERALEKQQPVTNH